MTISSVINRVEYAGNGSTTLFNFPYYFLIEADLVVIERNNTTGVETLKTLTTHYTVAGEGVPAGGSITMLVAPANGTTLVIYRDPVKTQDLDLVENDPMPAEEIEERFDKLTMIAQRLQDQATRAVQLTGAFPASFNTALPPLMEADRALIVNPTGDGWAMGPTADEIEDAQSYAVAANASAVAALASENAAAASEVAAELAALSAVWQTVEFKTFADSPLVLTDADRGKLFSIDASGGAVAVTMPQISTLTFNSPYVVGFIKSDNSGNAITLNRSNTDLINGATSKVIGFQWAGTVAVPDTGSAPDSWSAMDFGPSTPADGSVTKAKFSADALNLTVSTKSANYTLVAADEMILADASGGAFTLTLPAAASHSGRRYVIKKIDSNLTNGVTIDGNGAETIDGATTKVLRTLNEAIVIVSDGTNWRVVDRKTSTPWTAYSLTIGADTTAPTLGTTSVNTAMWKREGDSIKIKYSVMQTTVGVGGSGIYLFPLPAGIVIDTTKLSTVPLFSGANYHGARVGGHHGRLNATYLDGGAHLYDANNLYMVYDLGGGTAAPWSSGNTPLSGYTDVNLTFDTSDIPIVGWSE